MKVSKRVVRQSLVFLLYWGFSFGLVKAQSPVSENGQLKVCGTKLCNQNDQPIQLRGMSTHGIQWYGWNNCLTEASLDALANDWGADVLRISLYVQEGGYETDPVGFTNQVTTLINEATVRGMYALIDWHQLDPGDPNESLSSAKNFFTDIANAHKDKNNIIYDVCNEPNGVNWGQIKIYADQIIPVIRAIDSDAVILIGTHGWSTFGESSSGSYLDVVNNSLSFDNIMYTFHFYADSHRESYLSQLDKASDVLPVFVTEFGSQTYTGDGNNDFVMTQRYIDLMAEKQISWTCWNYSDDFRSGAVWKTGTCSGNGPWTVSQLKPAGIWIRDRILSNETPGETILSTDDRLKLINTENSINVFPNPSLGNDIHFSTKVGKQYNKANVKLISMLGQVVYEKDINVEDGHIESILSSKKLISGIYVLHVTAGTSIRKSTIAIR